VTVGRLTIRMRENGAQWIGTRLSKRLFCADIDSIASTLASIREKFSSLKEQAVSLLSTALIEENDPFIERKLKQIDELAVATPDTIALSLVPSGQISTRDSTAMTQGAYFRPF
jgi:hypothetical protein